MVIKNFIENLQVVDLNNRFLGVLKGTTYTYELSPDFYRTILKGGVAKKEIVSEYEFLKRLGYIPSKITVDSFVPLRPNLLLFILTNDCNLRCSYCYAFHGSYNKKISYMDRQTAFRAIDFLLKYGSKNPTIIFFGGEPLLNYEILVETVKYAIARNEKCGFFISTNGTLIDQEKAKFFKKYNFDVQVSIDGPPELHDRQRKYPSGKGSYEDVKRGIELLLKEGVDFRLRATVDNPKIELESVKTSLSDFSPCDISVRYNTRYYYSEENISGFIQDLINKIEKYKDDINFLNKIPEIAVFINYLFLHRNALGCVAGRTMLVVDVEGELYPCDVSMLFGEEFKIWNIFDSDLFSKYFRFKRKFLDLRQCEDCWLVGFCGGGCHITRLTNADLHEKQCERREQIMKLAVEVCLNLTLEQVLNSIKGTYSEIGLEKFKRCWNFSSSIRKGLRHINPIFITPVK